MYSLKDYFTAAELPAQPEWAEQVQMVSPPFDHQIGDLNHLASMTRSGLFNDAGIGKTRPLQAYALWLVGQGNKVVAVMPPILVPQFKESLGKTFIGNDKFVWTEMLQGTPKQRDKQTAKWHVWPDILITSYKMFVKYWRELEDKGYTCVIVDEAQALKTAGTQLHDAVKAFAGNVLESNGVVLSTGTPIETNPTDAYGYFAICNPRRYGSYKSFERTHCIFGEGFRYENAEGKTVNIPPQIVGYMNLEYLHEGMKALGRRIKKEDVFDLPPRLITEVKVGLSRQHKQLYDSLVEDRLAEIGERMIDLTTQSALYQATQRALICPEIYTDQEVDNEVLNNMDSILESLEGFKTVVYCWYTESVEKLATQYKHLNPATLYGGTKDREAQKRKFIDDPTCKIIIANPRSGGVGVDGLQNVSSHIIFAEVCPFPGTVQQAIARLHRSGQQSKLINVYFLVPVGTIAVKLRNDLVKKDGLQEQIMRDARTILKDLMGADGIQGSLDDIDLEVSNDTTNLSNAT